MKYHSCLRLGIAAVLVICAVACSTIPTGRTGVEWTPTSGTVNRSLGEGFHVVSPFSRIYTVDLREQEREEELDVLADNGLDIKMTSSILYQPIQGQVYQLIKETGPEYYGTLIAPYVRSSELDKQRQRVAGMEVSRGSRIRRHSQFSGRVNTVLAR